MAVLDKRVETLEELMAGVIARIKAIEAGGVTAVPSAQRPVKIKHRCNHEQSHPFTVLPDSIPGKAAIASLRGRYCGKCEQTRRQDKAIKVAKLRAEARDKEADALEAKAGVLTTMG